MDTKTEQPGELAAVSSSKPSQEPASSAAWLSQAGHSLHRWIDERTLAAPWLPLPLRRPLAGYLIGTLLVLALFVVLPFLLTYVSEFPLATLLILLLIALTAFTWGAGPSLMVMVVGMLLLNHLKWTPTHLAVVPESTGLILDDLFLFLVGLLISLLGGENARARRQAEQLRQVAEQERKRLDTVLEVLPAGVALSDAQGNLQRVNATFREIWGEDASLGGEVAQYPRFPGWRSETGAPIPSGEWALTRALRQGEVCPGEEVEIVTVDGRPATILDAAAPVRDPRGAIIGGVVAEMNITERKRMERALRQANHEMELAEAWFHGVVEQAPDALIVTDPRGRITLVNSQTEALFGYAREAFLGQPIERLIPERFQTIHLRHRALYLATPRTRPMGTGLELFGRRQDGSEFPVEINLGPITVGGEVHVIATCRDVTEQRRRERRIHDALQALVAMGEALVLPVAQTEHPESHVEVEVGALDLNRTMHHVTALIRDVFDCQWVQVGTVELGTGRYAPMAIVELSPEKTLEWCRFLEGVHLSDRLTVEQRAEVSAGRIMVLDAMSNPRFAQELGPDVSSAFVASLLGNEELIGLLGLRHAQSEPSHGPETRTLVEASARLATIILIQQRLLHQREEARATALALRETSKQMDAFLGMATHELKTPLTAMLLALQTSQRRLRNFLRREAALPDALVEQVEGIGTQLVHLEAQAKKLDRLVNDLLDLARIQAGKLQIYQEPTDLRHITQQAVEEQRQICSTRTIQVHLPLANRPVPILADADRISQVITNYLTNALKYSPSGRPVEAGLDLEPTQARVWVRDQGPGLPEAEREQVWQPYHRVPGIEVQSGTGVGLGLGLSICREIIALHEGQVGVESTPGQGSTFWFTLPLAKTPAA